MKGRKKDGSQLPNSIIIKWDHNSTGLDIFEKGREENGNHPMVSLLKQVYGSTGLDTFGKGNSCAVS